MTLRGFLWSFSALAACCFTLAWLGHARLGWSDDQAGQWAGAGTAFLLSALVLRLMPRWWRDHCDEAYAQPASRRYQRAMLPIMLGYAVLLITSLALVKSGIASVPLRTVVALLPVVPLVFMVHAALRYLRGIDELQRQIETEAIGIASLLVSLLYFGGGLLQKAKVIHLAAADAMTWVFPLTLLVYGVAKFFLTRRYR